jgi:hypothetical protein
VALAPAPLEVVAPTVPPRRPPASAVALLVAALVLGVGVPLALGFATGSMSIPHNDGWSYSRITALFARTGRIQLLGWNRAALLGQVVVLGPLGRWLQVQQTFVAVCGVVVLAATYDLLLPLVGRRRAAFAAATVAAWPAFGLLTTSFMLDVPAMAATMSCLAVGRRAIERRSARLLALSLGLGLWGFTIREQAVAAPFAVLLVAALVTRRSHGGFRRSLLGGLSLGGAGLAIAFELWRQGLPAGSPPALALPADVASAAAQAAEYGYFVLALALLPAVLLVARPWRLRGGALLLTAVGAAVAVDALLTRHAATFFPGNYLQPDGPYWQSGNGLPAAVVPAAAWWVVVLAACVSGVLLAGILYQRLRRLPPLLLVFLGSMVLGNVGTALTGQAVFDRYWLPVVPALLAAVLCEPIAPPLDQPRHVGRWLPAGVSLAGLFALSLTLTAAGIAYDTARWHTAAQLVAEGIPADQIQAGNEWTGYHSARGVADEAFQGSRTCVFVSASPISTLRPAEVVVYQPFVVAGTARLWIYDLDLWSGCRSAR